MDADLNKLAETWRNGVPLDEAWFEYAPRDLRTEYETMPGFLDVVQKPLERQDMQALFEALPPALANSTAIIEKRRALCDELLDSLYNEELTAIGYPTAPRPTGNLAIIDPEYFDDPKLTGARPN